MAGRTSVYSRINPPSLQKRRTGFSLIEILMVVVIMGTVFGVVGSLMSGYFRFSDMAVNVSVAQRRAQDVFSVLELPILDAGVGVPACSFDHYLSLGGVEPPVVAWGSPLSTVSNDTNPNRGDVLRVVYSAPLGTKNNGKEVFTFSAQEGADPSSKTYSGPIELTVGVSFDNSPNHIYPERSDTRSFITFAGAHMHPLLVLSSSSATKLELTGRRPHRSISDKDIYVRNTIHPYQDVRLLQGAVAYVDRNSVFHLIDVFDKDPSNMPSSSQNLPALSPVSLDWSGFHVEGIRAIRFEQDADKRFLTVHVLAEGDVGDSAFADDSTRVSDIMNIWSPSVVSLDHNVHYETFKKTWRTRSIQIDAD